ncbi:hypothetical protein [Ehrlichia ruminantium]|nr:hypothetical protein [Ehrlichia ruminantium]
MSYSDITLFGVLFIIIRQYKYFLSVNISIPYDNRGELAFTLITD